MTKGILIDIDDNEVRTKLIITDEMASILADELLNALDELPIAQWEEKCLGLEFQVEELEEIIEGYKNRIENLLNRYERGVF